MKEQYLAWIRTYKKENKSVRGKCVEASQLMREAFPELVLVPGYCNGAEHMWLKDGEGNIVDPTASQFQKPLQYEEWKPGNGVRFSCCPDCGADIYVHPETFEQLATGSAPDHRSFCDDRCEESYLKYLNDLL